MNHGVLLHVQHHQLIHAALEKLPQHPDGHGEAEGHNGHEDGGEGQGELLRPVEHVHQGEADGGAQEAVDGVENGVPAFEGGVKGADFPQNLGGEDEEHDDDLHGVGQVDHQRPLEDGGQQEAHQSQRAQEHALIVPVEELGHHGDDDQKAQQDVDHRHRPLSPEDIVGALQNAPHPLFSV